MATIVRYEPFALPRRWTRPSVDRIFDRLAQDALGITPGSFWGPRPAGFAANLYETEDAYGVDLPLPGVKPEDVEVSLQQDVLTLKAKRTWAAPEDAKSLWRGFGSGEWRQSFTLPGEVDGEKVEARLEEGVLRLRLPKAEHARPRQIKVQSGALEGGSAEGGAAEASAAEVADSAA
jgi:HSP20 family protein